MKYKKIILFVVLAFIVLLIGRMCSDNSEMTVGDLNFSIGFLDSKDKESSCKEQNCTTYAPPPPLCELKCPITEEELVIAKRAWKFIENNYNEKTGLTSAAHKYPSAATWDWANAVYAFYAAEKFGLITHERFAQMMKQFLTTMGSMDLFNNELPNKTYNTVSAKMTDYVNKVQKEGTGWSAADLGRLLSALNFINECEPTLSPEIQKLTLRFRYCRTLSVEGDMYGGSYADGKLSIKHEALTGYEEFLSRGYELWGHNASEARKYKFVEEVEVEGVKIPTDTRPFFSNFIESEPFWYLGFEYGVEDNESGRYICNIYKVQEKRYDRTGQLTAVTEDNIDRRPYFLFNTIYTHGEAWKTINQMGDDYDEFKTVSTKAAFGMKYLFDTPYANKVFEFVKDNYDPNKGYYAGIYEKRAGANKAMTLNTNSIILESMLAAKMGSLQRLHPDPWRGQFDFYRNTINNFRCLPTQNEFKIIEPYEPCCFDEENASSCNMQILNDAKIAWHYFEKNYNPSTGFVNGLNSYGVVRPEHIGKTIMATIAARQLGIINADAFESRIGKLMETLGRIKLYQDEMINVYYSAKTGEMVTQAGAVSATGNGWDLYSVAQLLTGLYFLERDYPTFREQVYTFVSKLNFKRVALKRNMQDRYFDGKAKGFFTEIKDYAKEFYIYNALQFFNIPAYSHFLDERMIDYKAVYNYEVPMGYEDATTNGESYLWTMIEHPYYLKYKHYSSNIYLALKDRYTITGKKVTSSEEAIAMNPYFIANHISAKGKLWVDSDKFGNGQSKRHFISTKTAFIYDALYGYADDYATLLKKEIDGKYSQDAGWYGGKHLDSDTTNRSLNLMTNAAILEAVLYKNIGNLYYANYPNLYDKIRLYQPKLTNVFYIKNEPIVLRYDAQMIMEKASDFSLNAWIERDGDGFIVKVGTFEKKQDALKAMQELKSIIPSGTIEQGDVDYHNFMMANRYFGYDYHIPYENINIVEPNQNYQNYLKKRPKPIKKNESIKQPTPNIEIKKK